jgi:hypothetical protein
MATSGSIIEARVISPTDSTMMTSQLAHCPSLDLLRRIPSDSLKLAYIDPPWQQESGSTLVELYLHTAALCKACLAENGVIVWHAVPELISDTRFVLDKVFGRDFFETEFVLKRQSGNVRQLRPSSGHSSLIVYSKTGEFHYKPPTREATEQEAKRFNKKDADGRRYRLDSLLVPMIRPTLAFDWEGKVPPQNQSWRFSRERLEALRDEGRIEFPDQGMPRLRRFFDETPPPPLGSVWDDLPLSPLERNSGRRHPGQQPIELARRILDSFTVEGDRIVDPYCGSGTFIVAAESMKRAWDGADTSAEAIETTLSRLSEIPPSEVGFSSVLSVDELEVHHRLTELLAAYRVDADPHASDTHVLVGRSESKVLEFKETLALDLRTQTKEKHIETAVMKTIGAFLNSDGGTLLVGVADDNSVPGVRRETKVLFKDSTDKYLLHFKNLLHSQIGAEFYPLLDYRIVRLDEIEVLRIDVRPAREPCFVGNDFYVRTNPATDKLEGPKMLDYVRRRFDGRKDETK